MRPNESGTRAAHRAVGAALKGFPEDQALEALAMVAAEWLFSHYQAPQRPGALRRFDALVRHDVQIVSAGFESLGLPDNCNRPGKLPELR